MNIKTYIFSIAAGFALFATGCDKLSDFGDTNVNPNGIPEAIPAALFTNASSSIPGLAAIATPAYYAQLFSETQYTDASRYSTVQFNFSGTYSGILYDLQNIININSSNNLSQAAKIMQQYVYWTMTDRVGDIPYSEALKGSEIQNPKYDTQEEVYKGMIQALKDAAASFDNTSLISGDVSNYSGNPEDWKRLANTLRLLMAQQLSKRYPDPSGYAATEFKAALADGVIDENSENWAYAFPGGNLSNPWYNTYNGRRDIAQSKTMTDIMVDLDDNRQASYASDAQGRYTEIGVPYGLVRADAEAFTSANPNWAYVLNARFRQQTSTVTVIPAAVVALARAEAADCGWTNEDVKTMYEQGIRLSHEQWEVPAPSAAYLAQSRVALGATGNCNNLQKIATQRWIAVYPDGLQAWNLWRRTGYPELTPAPGAAAGTPIPRRYTYSPALYSSNAEGIAAAVDRLPGGEDIMDARIWWDQ